MGQQWGAREVSGFYETVQTVHETPPDQALGQVLCASAISIIKPPVLTGVIAVRVH